ncbi:MAG: Hypothetical protein AJITA_01376 [Acetilactobacillus jinshanensis]
MKSLLMTHVFLFIGYSLRDINLNLSLTGSITLSAGWA